MLCAVVSRQYLKIRQTRLYVPPREFELESLESESQGSYMIPQDRRNISANDTENIIYQVIK